MELGLYARVFLDIDLLKGLSNQVLIQIRDYEFFVFVQYEQYPSFCKHCCVIGQFWVANFNIVRTQEIRIR